MNLNRFSNFFWNFETFWRFQKTSNQIENPIQSPNAVLQLSTIHLITPSASNLHQNVKRVIEILSIDTSLCNWSDSFENSSREGGRQCYLNLNLFSSPFLFSPHQRLSSSRHWRKLFSREIFLGHFWLILVWPRQESWWTLQISPSFMIDRLFSWHFSKLISFPGDGKKTVWCKSCLNEIFSSPFDLWRDFRFVLFHHSISHLKLLHLDSSALLFMELIQLQVSFAQISSI